MTIGKRWYAAFTVGATWGLGHGVGASLMGALAFSVKQQLHILLLADYMEYAVGGTLIVIGLVGIRKASLWEKKGDAIRPDVEEGVDSPQQLPTEDFKRFAILSTGVFHGLSGSGHVLGVLPALTMPSWSSALAYLASFCVGTMLAMSAFTSAVGELSVALGQRVKSPRLPGLLSLWSSYFALLMGIIWIVTAFLHSDAV